MNADDLEQLAEDVKRGLRDMMLQQSQQMEERLGGLVRHATEVAANPTANEVRRLTDIMGQMEV